MLLPERPASGAISSVRRSPAQTVAARSANALTIARPMPRAAPTTITRLSANAMCTTVLRSPQLLMRGFRQAPDHSSRDDRGCHQIKNVRQWRGEPVDQPDRDERRKAAEDRDRECVARGHPQGTGAGREDFR